MNIEQWSTVAANIVTSLGIIGLIAFYFSHRQAGSQFSFTVMLSCIDRFQQLAPIIRDDADDLARIKKYIDLTNEEFFYFQRGYISKVVITEWLDSIVDMFPLYKKGQDIPSNYETLPLKQIHDMNLLKSYPRLRHAFTLRADQSAGNKHDIVRAVAENLGIRLRAKHFRAANLIA